MHLALRALALTTLTSLAACEGAFHGSELDADDAVDASSELDAASALDASAAIDAPSSSSDDAGPSAPDAFAVDAAASPDASSGYTVADVLARLGSCSVISASNYASDSGESATIPVCGDTGIVWFQADMDIDCDGGRESSCTADPYYMAETAATDSTGQPVDANAVPYIVLPGNSATRFRYSDHDIRLGQVALVIYEGRMAFGVFADVGPTSILGEASYAMAEEFGIDPDPSTGGSDGPVTYVVFTGSDARVSPIESRDAASTVGRAQLDAFMSGG